MSDHRRCKWAATAISSRRRSRTSRVPTRTAILGRREYTTSAPDRLPRPLAAGATGGREARRERFVSLATAIATLGVATQELRTSRSARPATTAVQLEEPRKVPVLQPFFATMNIRFVSALTSEDEDRLALALIKAVAALLESADFPYTLRIETSANRVFDHSQHVTAHVPPNGVPV
jgi:hypothetical protein